MITRLLITKDLLTLNAEPTAQTGDRQEISRQGTDNIEDKPGTGGDSLAKNRGQTGDTLFELGEEGEDERVTFSENGDYGDAWTFVAISEDRLVLWYELGKRDPKTALHFLTNLQERIKGRFQLTTDGWRTYRLAVETVFGSDVDFAQLVKTYAASEEGRERYSPSDIVSITRLLVSGKPKFSKISTSFVERSNLTMRMRMRRLTRLTNGFSKKRKNLAAALALHFFDYNFRRIHCSLRVTPAMQAGISDHIWEWRELFAYQAA